MQSKYNTIDQDSMSSAVAQQLKWGGGTGVQKRPFCPDFNCKVEGGQKPGGRPQWNIMFEKMIVDDLELSSLHTSQHIAMSPP